MKLILEIMPHTDNEQLVHRVIEKFPVTVGRGFDNDVIVSDPHVSPHHLSIDYDGHACHATDLGSDNGLGVNRDAPVHGKRVTVHSGDALHIGQTELKVYLPHHPVARAVRLHKTHPAFGWFARPLHMWASLVLATALMTGWSYLEIWSEETGMTLTAAGGGAVLAIVLWATLWSVAGRLIRHKSHFMSHATMAALYLSAGVIGWYIEAYADFLLNENGLAHAISYGLNFVLLAFLIRGSLALASRMSWARRRMAAVLFSAGVMVAILIVNLVAVKTFNQQPQYPETLEPYLEKIAPADDIHDFMAGNEKLFNAK